MTEPMITKTWIAGLVVLAAGLVVAVVGAFLMVGYGGNFTQIAGTTNSYQFVPRLDSFFWTTIAVIIVGAPNPLARERLISRPQAALEAFPRDPPSQLFTI